MTKERKGRGRAERLGAIASLRSSLLMEPSLVPPPREKPSREEIREAREFRRAGFARILEIMKGGLPDAA